MEARGFFCYNVIMNLPSKKQCNELLKKYHTPVSVIKHSAVVTKIAEYLADEFNKTKTKVNKDLINRACVLHDLLRVCDIPNDNFFKFADPEDIKQKDVKQKIWAAQCAKYKGMHHSEAAEDVLGRDYPELAQVIREHMFDVLLKDEFTCWEGKIVSYADKRVDHDRIVTLNQRIEEGKKRWHTDNENLDLTYKKLLALEKEILDVIGQKPDVINQL